MMSYSSESGSDTDGGSGPERLEFSYLMLDEGQLEEKLAEEAGRRGRSKTPPELVRTLRAYNNRLGRVPEALAAFTGLRRLDLSNNRLSSLPEFLTGLPLTAFVAKNNFIPSDRLPKSFGAWSSTLRVFDLGGNRLNSFPPQLFELASLKCLNLGSNLIEDVPRTISRIVSLSVLCLGGNQLTDVPDTLGSLEDLEVLILSDNQLESLPPSIANLKKLKTLQLHNNRLRTLPTEIITLKCLSELSLHENPLVVQFVSDMTHDPASLQEISARVIKILGIQNKILYPNILGQWFLTLLLSLRENPLVVQFVSDMTHDPASLQEISARVIKILGIQYTPADLPQSLRDYLNCAHHCVNPRCNGVYFDNRVEHIKFVDFCGKYRIPLLQYLCSSKCVLDNSAVPGPSTVVNDMMRKVLLG